MRRSADFYHGSQETTRFLLNVFRELKLQQLWRRNRTKIGLQWYIYMRIDQIWIPLSDFSSKLGYFLRKFRWFFSSRFLIHQTYPVGWFCVESYEGRCQELVKGCLHYILRRGVNLVPMPLSHALHVIPPNKVLHLYFSYMGLGVNGKNYTSIFGDVCASY